MKHNLIADIGVKGARGELGARGLGLSCKGFRVKVQGV